VSIFRCLFWKKKGSIRRDIVRFQTRRFFFVGLFCTRKTSSSSFSDWLANEGAASYQGFILHIKDEGLLHIKEPPSKIQVGPQRASRLAGGGKSKSGGGNGKAIHVILLWSGYDS